MPSEIRLVTDEERPKAQFILSYAFNDERADDMHERMRHIWAMGDQHALYDDGEMAALLQVMDLRMFIHGASIPFGGISGVACLPEHRRKGYVGQLLRRSLEIMLEAGYPLSSLHTPHPALYRRYGWMFASTAVLQSFDPKQIQPIYPPPAQGRAHRIAEEDWPTIAELYERFARPRNGYFDRDESWWRQGIFRRPYDEKRQPNDIAVWSDGNGKASGYLVYRPVRIEHDIEPSSRVHVEELIALDRDAQTGLLRYLLAHDLCREVTIWQPEDSALPLTVDEPWRIKRQPYHGFMLRIVDVEKAVAARPPAKDAPEGAFTIALADASAPWNQGVWRIECSGGKLSAGKARGAADVSTDAAVFAALYNGFLRTSEAVRSGLAEAGDATAVEMADRILAADYRPYPSDEF
jgi:predicted acetyltransferase